MSYFALTYMNGQLFQSAISLPSQQLTLRSSRRSHLLPIISFGILSTPFYYSCEIQFFTSSNDLRSLIAQVMMTPDAPLKYVSVRVLNLYCPAVSQSCSLIFLFSLLFAKGIVSIFDLKSTPIVGVCMILQVYQMNLSSILVLPTAELPIITIFARQSYSFYLKVCFLCLWSIVMSLENLQHGSEAKFQLKDLRSIRFKKLFNYCLC